MPIERLTHMGICVSNLERSARFYREVLGCAEVGRLEMEGEPAATLNQIDPIRLRAAYLERDGWRLELLEFPVPGSTGTQQPRPMNQLGMTHLSFRVTDFDEICARIESAGGNLLPASSIGRPGGRTRAIMVTDPDGVRIELIEGPGDINAVPGSPGWLQG